MMEERIREGPSKEEKDEMTDEGFEEWRKNVWENQRPVDPAGSLGSPKLAKNDDLGELKSRLKDYVISQTRMNDLHD